MPSISFPFRLIFDKAFFDDVKVGRFASSKPHVLLKLIYINDRSKLCKKHFNIISKKDFEGVLRENPHIRPEMLRASAYDMNIEEIERISDEVERTIKLAIDVLDEEPHRAIIITSDKKLESYTSNSHFIGVKEINAMAGDAAIKQINDYFQDCAGR